LRHNYRQSVRLTIQRITATARDNRAAEITGAAPPDRIAWITRPGFNEIEERVTAILDEKAAKMVAKTALAALAMTTRPCRGRHTDSHIGARTQLHHRRAVTDVEFDWPAGWLRQ
jgi:hypothetical protein